MPSHPPTTLRHSLAAISAALGVLAALACSPPTVRPPNLILIVADTLRADHLGIHGYERDTSPAIDRFARENLFFRRAYSAAPWTSPSLASIFTARYPSAHGVLSDSVGGAIPVDALSADHVTLAEQLRDAGYATAGLSANGWVSPERGYAQGFERFERREDLLTPALNRRAREILRELAAQERPFFFYVQFMDPHLPNAPPAALIDRFHPRGRERPGRDGEVLDGLDSLVDTIARYDAEIWRLDRGIAQLFSTLRELGLYDDAVIAFVSDHGEQFYEHGEYGHGLKLHDEEIRIPLILKAPGLRGAVDDLVSSIDLAPALLELAGAAALPAAQGLSLLTQRPERAERGAFSEGTMERNHKALIDGQGRKLVLAFGGRSADVVAPSETGEVIGLFDLSRGAAAEKEPLVDARATAELRLQLREQYAHSLALREGIRPRTAELAPATVRALEALGYGAAGAQPAAGDD